MTLNFVINLSYIVSAILFGVGLKMLGSPDSARKGNFISALGMLLAIVATLLTKGLSYHWIILGLLVGAIIGTVSAKVVPLTAMPEMVALFNGFGGLASLLVAWAIYHSTPPTVLFTSLTIFLSIFIGGVTFTGSMIAWAKLNGSISGRPILYRGHHIINLSLLTAVLLGGVYFTMNPAANYSIFLGIVVLSLGLGVLMIIPIGGADMPVVISLLNSYSGLAACATGFVIKNNMLIVAGSLVGASGIILTQIMCKAMNRSLNNVLFSGFGAAKPLSQTSVKGETKPISIPDAYLILEAARFVVIVPGYGLAVAQAQHVVRELGQLLMENGAEVRYAIHPVAGRMPGHMNVLLSEADVPYDQLFTMDDINPVMEKVDLCIVIGANDVVNPAALHDKSSPIYGMPIIEALRAKTVFVLKRSMATGFSGIPNELFYYDNTRMLFGDAKTSIQGLVAEFKQAS